MRMFGNFKSIISIGCFAFLFSLNACSSDSSSSSTSEPDFTESSSSKGDSSSDSSEKSSNSNSSSSSETKVSSSSVMQETVTSDEVLNEAKKVVNGTCAPTVSEISKGGLASWNFYRSEGEIFDQIMAPFIWVFEGSTKDTIKGNGLNAVNMRYENSGTYKASLLVDGNTIECSPLQVQGVPIQIESCEPNVLSAKVGDVITWTVNATSESKISGYSWTSTFGEVSGTAAEGQMVATSEMHKQNIYPTVSVTNEDKTTKSYACKAVTVTDPNQVDVIIAHTTVTDSSAQVFPGGQTVVAQYPSKAVNCQMVCGAQGNGVILEIDGESHTIDYSLNITPASCTDGKAAGTKITVTASMNVYCYVTY